MQTLANVSFGAKIGYFIYQIALFRQLSLAFRSLVPYSLSNRNML